MKTPNLITIARIILSPIFLIIFSIDSLWSIIVCILIAGLMELSDYLDGMIARKNKQISDFGKLMDPFADSISRFTIFLSFLSAGLAPVWLIAIFFYRDTLVSIVRVFAMKEGVVVSARSSGKLKAVVQAICIFIVLFMLLFQKLSLFTILTCGSNFTIILTGAISLAAIVTLWSAIDYWKANNTLIVKAMKINPDQ